MRNTIWRPFSYLTIDRQAAQEHLNRMAGKGWELVKTRAGFAQYRRTERTDLTYFLDFEDPKEGVSDPEYHQLCTDAGWEFVEQVDYLAFYASRPGTSPAPIQTDPEVELQRYRAKVIRPILVSFAILALILLLFALQVVYSYPFIHFRGLDSLRDFLAVTLTLYCGAMICLTLPLLLLWGAVYLFLLLARMLQWRSDAEAGRPLRASSPALARLWAGAKLTAHLLLVFLLLLIPVDFLNGQGSTTWASRAIFVSLLALAHHSPSRRRWYALLMTVAAVSLCFSLLPRSFRQAFPTPAPSGPILASASFDREPDGSASFLGSRAQWSEHIPPAREGQINGLSLLNTWHWNSAALARGLLPKPSEGLRPARELLADYPDCPVAPSELEGMYASIEPAPGRSGSQEGAILYDTRFYLRRDGALLTMDNYSMAGPWVGLGEALEWLGQME